MKRVGLSTILWFVFCGATWAGGPGDYQTPFFEDLSMREGMAGHLPDHMDHHHGIHPLLVWLQLSGRYTREHAELFATYLERDDDPDGIDDPNYQGLFVERLQEEGYQTGAIERWRLVTHTDVRDGIPNQTSNWIENCRDDAFKATYATLVDRESRYGFGSAELARWIEAQIAVFDQCSADTGDPPAESDSAWQPFERHDREYQIAAWYFYRQEYLEAAKRFRDISETDDSPWRQLARYLVPRSLARQATINEPVEWEGYQKKRATADRLRYLNEARTQYETLAEDAGYLAEYPSIMTQLMRIDTELHDGKFVGLFESRIIDNPSAVDARDLGDFEYMAGVWRRPSGRHPEYRRWFNFAMRVHDEFAHSGGKWDEKSDVDSFLDVWRADRSLPLLFLALSVADERSGLEILRELMAAGDELDSDTPGYLTMLGHRLRLSGIVGEPGTVTELVQEMVREAEGGDLTLGVVNALRLQLARAAPNWKKYIEWASLKPLDLPWSDEFAERLPESRFGHISRDTTLFSEETTGLIDVLFTPSMILSVLSASGLSDYQRSRLAIAGWTKAMLAEDLDAALKLSPWIIRHAPHLATSLAGFEAAEDKHFEAAWIVIHHPGLSPWLEPGVGRTEWYGLDAADTEDAHFETMGLRPAADRVGLSMSRHNWWCTGSVESIAKKVERIGGTLPYFARSIDLDQTAEDFALQQKTAAEAFGPQIIRYARGHLNDPRVPEALHRVVFATRYSCESGPGAVSRGAYVLLHEHFGYSRWADKTPHWYE